MSSCIVLIAYHQFVSDNDSSSVIIRQLTIDHHLSIVLYLFTHFYSASHSMTLSEALPTTAIDTVSELTSAKRYGQLQVKDLPNVFMRQLEWDSNPRPCGRNASTPPMCHHAPQVYKCSLAPVISTSQFYQSNTTVPPPSGPSLVVDDAAPGCPSQRWVVARLRIICKCRRWCFP